MDELDGTWDVERVSGFLPPLIGVQKRIDGAHGATTVGGLRATFDVVGRELRYRLPLVGFVDVVEPTAGESWDGHATFRGREYARFRLRPAAATVRTVSEELVKHLDETIAMEENVKRMLGGMIQTMDDPQVIDLLEHHKAETEQHSQRLRRRLQTHGASPSMVRQAGGILGALVKLPLDIVRTEKAGRNARDVYATEHMEIAAYRLLERLAVRAGDEETAAVARQNRGEEEAMARRLDELWDRFAAQSLREEGVTV